VDKIKRKPKVKISDEQLKEILRLRRESKLSLQTIGRMFNIGAQRVYILTRKFYQNPNRRRHESCPHHRMGEIEELLKTNPLMHRNDMAVILRISRQNMRTLMKDTFHLVWDNTWGKKIWKKIVNPVEPHDAF